MIAFGTFFVAVTLFSLSIASLYDSFLFIFCYAVDFDDFVSVSIEFIADASFPPESFLLLSVSFSFPLSQGDFLGGGVTVLLRVFLPLPPFPNAANLPVCLPVVLPLPLPVLPLLLELSLPHNMLLCCSILLPFFLPELLYASVVLLVDVLLVAVSCFLFLCTVVILQFLVWTDLALPFLMTALSLVFHSL